MAQENVELEPASAKSSGEATQLKKDLEESKAKCEEYLNGWKRERADFLNYKKDEMERISELAKYANTEIILKIIPVLDNLYLAAEHIKDPGVNQIKNQLADFLTKEGIEPIKTIGEKFDPNTMEAVEGDGDTVAEEVQRGYTMNGKLIRVAKIKISK
jgi:molecular chaperone GrpE